MADKGNNADYLDRYNAKIEQATVGVRCTPRELASLLSSAEAAKDKRAQNKEARNTAVENGEDKKKEKGGSKPGSS